MVAASRATQLRQDWIRSDRSVATGHARMAGRGLRRTLETSSRGHRARLREARIMSLPADIELRPATFDDIDWLDHLHTICMREKVELVYPWDPDRFRTTFDPTINH